MTVQVTSSNVCKHPTLFYCQTILDSNTICRNPSTPVFCDSASLLIISKCRDSSDFNKCRDLTTNECRNITSKNCYLILTSDTICTEFSNNECTTFLTSSLTCRISSTY
jgi:hypothetical protein